MPPQDVRFLSGSSFCAGWWYRPEHAGKRPVVVMAHGFGATRELGLDLFARRFCDAGMCVLAFDYRHYGTSEGEPRELLSISRQQADYVAAVEFVRTRPEVDPSRVVLWGTSFSGGHVLALAARNLPVNAVIAQVPFATGAMTRRGPDVLRRFLVGIGLGLYDVVASTLRHEPLYTPVLGEDGAVAAMPGAEVEHDYRRLLPPVVVQDQRWRNRVAARIALTAPFYEPTRKIRKVRIPVLLVVGDHDTLCPPEFTVERCARQRNVEIVGFGGGHFDCYEGPGFEHSMREQLAFLRRHGFADASLEGPGLAWEA